jgi:hypothetical protein
LDPGVLGPIVIGDALRDFCSSPTPLGKLSPRCDRQRNLSGNRLIVLADGYRFSFACRGPFVTLNDGRQH